MQEFKLKHLMLKLFEITISYHSSGVNTLQRHFMYKNLKSFVSRCECVSCFDNILVVNPEERFTHDAAQKKLGSCFGVKNISAFRDFRFSMTYHYCIEITVCQLYILCQLYKAPWNA